MSKNYLEKVQEEFNNTIPKDNKENNDLASLFENVFSDESSHEKDKIIEILFEFSDLRKISDVGHNEIIDITVLLTFSDYINSPLIRKFCNHRLSLSLSKDRKSREEVVEIYKTNVLGDMGSFISPEEQTRGRFSRVREKLRF